MKDKVKKGALTFAALKVGQQVAHDLEGVILNNTALDVSIFGAEQIFRIGAAGAAACTIDEAVSYGEELVLPKYLRGLLPLAAATIGTAIAINYLGDYFNNVEGGLGVWETTKYLISQYQNNLAKLVTFNSNLNAGFLAGAALSLKSGVRLCKNIGQEIADYAEKKRAQSKIKKKQEIEDISKRNDRK